MGEAESVPVIAIAQVYELKQLESKTRKITFTTTARCTPLSPHNSTIDRIDMNSGY